MSSRGLFYTWTYCRTEDPILNKLDRAIINDQWLSSFPDSLARFDPPGDSDHSPCLVSLDGVENGSKRSFKYFTHPRFRQEISEACNASTLVGSAMFTLSSRMSAAKLCCRRLNKEGFGDISRELRKPWQTWNRFKGFSSPNHPIYYSGRNMWAETNGSSSLMLSGSSSSPNQGLDGTKMEMLIRPSFIEWSSPISAANQFVISGIRMISGVLPLSVSKIRELLPFRYPPDISTALVSIPTDVEITNVVFHLPKNKAPGPDGLSMEFFLDSWDLVGADLIKPVKEFFNSGSLLRNFNATAIILIPKIQVADQLSQFRPISCCSTVYKVINRFLTNRLKLFVSLAVQRNQIGLFKGRYLCENVLLAFELVTYFHKVGTTSRGYLQINISKAYDNLNWEFLFNVLTALDLPNIFVNWIKECVTTASYSIAVNGELVGYFPGKKGLRQGDSMSSQMFVLAMDVLLDLGAIKQSFMPHPQCFALLITHLSFADDVLIFFDGTSDLLEGILSILDEFRSVSGLGISRQKSVVFIDGGSLQRCKDLADPVGLQYGSLPVCYLGVPLSTQKLKKQDYQPLLDRIRNCVCWILSVYAADSYGSDEGIEPQAPPIPAMRQGPRTRSGTRVLREEFNQAIEALLSIHEQEDSLYPSFKVTVQERSLEEPNKGEAYLIQDGPTAELPLLRPNKEVSLFSISITPT
ncbi:uncharacterized protein LOC112082116 [Eutrema salsugineum]|uniref:uncharacterized protein LOC112082116 n=1 Tax=Eutrema salsugineum TaxID=72664 RepID=UPI000CED46A8|nr:uncharacterized protein LOC112082116 [Eutrema salsugineum]